MEHEVDRRRVLQWARACEDPRDDARARRSNDAVEGYLDGTVDRRRLRAAAYIDDAFVFESPGEVMAYFAADVALARESDWEGTINEATAKAEEYLPHDLGQPSGADGSRWSPSDADDEMAEWESLLGRRAGRPGSPG